MTSWWARWRLKSPALRLFTQPFIQARIKETIKAPRHWPLCGKSSETGEFRAQRASKAENITIWWRHHESDPTSSGHHVVFDVSYGFYTLLDSKFLLHKAGVTAHMDIATSRVGGADNILFILNWQHMNEVHILEWQIIAVYNATCYTCGDDGLQAQFLDVFPYYL